MELQYEVTESRLLQEVLPCGYVDSALPQWNVSMTDGMSFPFALCKPIFLSHKEVTSYPYTNVYFLRIVGLCVTALKRQNCLTDGHHIWHGDLPVLATCQCGQILKMSHTEASHDSAMPVRYYKRICINKGFIGWDQLSSTFIHIFSGWKDFS